MIVLHDELPATTAATNLILLGALAFASATIGFAFWEAMQLALLTR